MKQYDGVEIWLHEHLVSALDGGEWSALSSDHFINGEKAPGTHWKGGRVGPIARLDAVAKRKIPCPRGESNLGLPSLF
jgi:hypothetical protein